LGGHFLVSRTIILHPGNRQHALRTLSDAPDGYVLTVAEPKRTLDQNSLFWALLSELSVRKVAGREATPEAWKLLVMHACGHACQFEIGLNGQPFPVGFRSSKLTKRQMGDLIDWIYAYASEQGVTLEHVAPAHMKETR